MGLSFKKATEEELSAIVDRGNAAHNFIGSPFGRMFAESVRAEFDECEKDGKWNPGKSTDIEAIAVIKLFNDGKKEGLNKMATMIERFVINKDEALKELKIRKERGNK